MIAFFKSNILWFFRIISVWALIHWLPFIFLHLNIQLVSLILFSEHQNLHCFAIFLLIFFITLTYNNRRNIDCVVFIKTYIFVAVRRFWRLRTRIKHILFYIILFDISVVKIIIITIQMKRFIFLFQIVFICVFHISIFQ